MCFRITRHCNLACSHCRAGSSPATREYASVGDFLGFAVAARVRLGLQHVSISGGEPALHPELLDVVLRLVELGIHVSITTNGTLPLSARLGKVFKQFPENVRMRVSLDGSKELHERIRGPGTFGRAVRELRRLQRAAGWVSVNTVVTEDVLRDSTELATLLRESNVPEWALILPVPQGSAAAHQWTSEQFLPLALSIRERAQAVGYLGRIRIWDFLSTPNTSVLIEATGEITLSGISDGDGVLLGTLRDHDLDFIESRIQTVTAANPRAHFGWSGWRKP